jgi:LEA14-like dessication related protein
MPHPALPAMGAKRGDMRWWLVLVVGSGCQALQDFSKLKDLRPEVHFDQLKVDAIDFQGLDGKFVLDVTNPYPAKLDLAEFSWALGLAGSPFLDGTNDKGLLIERNESSKVRIPFGVKFLDIFNVVSGVKGEDNVPYELDTELSFQTPIGKVKVPLQHEGDLPALHLPKISLKALRVEKLDVLKQIATLELDLGLNSDQGSPLNFETFTYGIKLAGNDVASGNAVIGALADSKTVTLPIDLKLLNLGEVVVNAITKKQQIKVRLTGDASVGTPFGTIPLSFDEINELIPK